MHKFILFALKFKWLSIVLEIILKTSLDWMKTFYLNTSMFLTLWKCFPVVLFSLLWQWIQRNWMLCKSSAFLNTSAIFDTFKSIYYFKSSQNVNISSCLEILSKKMLFIILQGKSVILKNSSSDSSIISHAFFSFWPGKKIIVSQ